MTDRAIKDVAASVKQRLLNVAHERGDDFNLLLTRYVLERFLYRLTLSQHASDFVVKGATLFTLWSAVPHRSTRDVDLLGFGSPDLTRLQRVFAAVVALPVSIDDGVVFDSESVRARPIREQAIYDGIRIELRARLGNARILVQVDVGFGDSIVPNPEVREFPVVLDMPAPKLRAYAPETVVAEKLHALVQLGMLNTRLKDYFDLWYLATHQEFNAQLLSTTIAATFSKRQSELPADVPLGLDDAFANDPLKQKQWSAFLNRTAPKIAAPDLPTAVVAIRSFLQPILEKLRDDQPFTASWKQGVGWTLRS
jgi:predicted nucleotidyltransferase component of viral defense system